MRTLETWAAILFVVGAFTGLGWLILRQLDDWLAYSRQDEPEQARPFDWSEDEAA